ncbi:MAG: AmmeMemoRadiSam system protein A [Candidatus Thiodiazotropha lotti]|uniref:AmmeMemoRadiSam system protein A n=1 Tax=Candidatus Thiodiazotropha lotti TaxID=2792787 RepID=A0A9E4K3A2_9GAMM|nr:AmmeMemoRadiSam system protein A [Candidatus Thiodiazotropha lotti]MCG7938437.1 AmmeMemoRadiSam system protein A [Candidatus Thiodiazotropha lotti]MCG7986510.1 AmmeMemoRadiSam system protein A [Candidatus Thiodiazotropha lotti]MCG8011971.1 AmmeMemoRadiSam system protein A [Candidatus Thiodiazotropha lotti]MCG8021397.1 AmmeMemoRadiSam system protein A [Candidatus Thiodiazotropha lotti]
MTSEFTTLSDQDRARLLDIANRSIDYGLKNHTSLEVKPEDYPETLRAIRASFVTLKLADQLRGCIGHLEAIQPVVCDVAGNAYAAAFRDPRFPPLTPSEREQVAIHLSLLTPSVAIEFSSEADLLAKIRPGIDGLILIEGIRRGTFLPSVWESLPNPRDFVDQLKLKAGLPSNYWSDSLEVLRYESESFAE